MSLPRATATDPVWLRVGMLIDGTGAAVARDAHVVYDNRRVRFVGRDGTEPPPDVLRAGRRGPDLHAPEAALLPGLIEAHAHLFLEGGELDPERRSVAQKRPAAELLPAALPRLGRLVRLGIAGVRDAGDRDGVGLALSRLYSQGDDARPLMPYVESPGAAIHHQGRYGGFMADPLEAFSDPADCVAARVAAGADRIKLIPTGIINFRKGLVTAEPQMTTPEVAAIVAAARAHGRQTFAHASGDAGIERAIEGGVDSIEHGFFIRDDQLARMRDRRIAWVPTFAPVQLQVDEAARFGWDAQIVGNLQRILDQHAASLGRAHAMGVIIVAGSDAGSVGVAHGVGFLRELELMARAGMPAAAVIHAATGAGAGRFAYREDIGRIAVGARPRFVLARRSPLEDIRALAEPRTIIFDGEVFASTTDTAGL